MYCALEAVVCLRVANIRQKLMLFSTTWLEGSRGFSFFSPTTTRRQHRIDYEGLWTLLNRIPFDINGRLHANDINIAQLQTMNC